MQRPFACYVDDCTASYRRKDHLNRHVLTHKGKLFKCPMENCKSEFSVQGNVSRHVKNYHSDGDGGKDDTGKDDTVDGDSQTSECSAGQKQHVCTEIGCGKVFKYASRLQKHQDSHGKCAPSYCQLGSTSEIVNNQSCFLKRYPYLYLLIFLSLMVSCGFCICSEIRLGGGVLLRTWVYEVLYKR